MCFVQKWNTWELVRNMKSQASPKTYNYILTRSPDEHLKSSAIQNGAYLY